jgi:hypothetical protein
MCPVLGLRCPPYRSGVRIANDAGGSALFSQDPRNPEVIFVRMGSFDDDPGVRPGGRVHVASAAVWEPIPDDGLTRFPGRVGE